MAVTLQAAISFARSNVHYRIYFRKFNKMSDFNQLKSLIANNILYNEPSEHVTNVFLNDSKQQQNVAEAVNCYAALIGYAVLTLIIFSSSRQQVLHVQTR